MKPTPVHLPRFALPLLACMAAGCVINVDADRVVVREQQRFTVAEGAEVFLETFDGSIRVQSWERPEVLVEVQKRAPDHETAEALEVRASQEGNRVRIEAPPPAVMREFVGIGNVSGPSVSYDVSVPRDASLHVNTGDGSIAVSNVTGMVDLRSGDGSIRVDRVSGEVSAHTGDGSVRAIDISGRASIESGDGSVHVQGRVEALRARTRDGSVVIEADEGSAMTGDWDISTGDGSIVFRVPAGFNAEIDAQSRDGRVRAETAGLDQARSDGDSESLRGRLGAGGHVVRLRTGDGSIRVLNR